MIGAGMSWLTALILWTHVLSGSLWALACLCMGIAGVALAAESDEMRDLLMKVAPKLNRVNTAAAATLLLTGLANLYIVGQFRHFKFSPLFVRVLAAKAVLFVLMLAALGACWRAERAMLGGRTAPGEAAVPGAVNRLTALWTLTAMMGAAALGLGLWLAGS